MGTIMMGRKNEVARFNFLSGKSTTSGTGREADKVTSDMVSLLSQV